MALDPVTGPLTRSEFAELVAAPYGEAVKRIRKHDPLYARAPGEKVLFRVEATSKMRGVAFVKAENQAEADKLSDELTDASFDWQDDGYGMEIISVKIVK